MDGGSTGAAGSGSSKNLEGLTCSALNSELLQDVYNAERRSVGTMTTILSDVQVIYLAFVFIARTFEPVINRLPDFCIGWRFGQQHIEFGVIKQA